MVVVGYEEMTTYQRERNYVMDEREYYREDIDTVECTECGQAHLRCSEGLLEGIELGALMEAQGRLSSEGMETLMMVGQAGEKLPGGLIEAWELAEKENISRLSSYDAQVLRDYGARITMIEGAREELNEYTFARD
jgi:ferredoxin